MNYSPITSRLNYKAANPALGGILPYNGPHDTPQFEKYAEDKLSSRYKYKEDLARTAMKQITYGASDCNNNESEVERMFFSHENMKRLQKMLKQEIYVKSNKQFVLEDDQSQDDLLIAARAVFIDESRNLPFKIIHQVKVLNRKVIDYIFPDVLTNVKQAYAYQQEINSPLKPIARPLNVSNAGRRTAPSVTSVWGF